MAPTTQAGTHGRTSNDLRNPTDRRSTDISILSWLVPYSTLTLIPSCVVGMNGFAAPVSFWGAVIGWIASFVTLMFFGRAMEVMIAIERRRLRHAYHMGPAADTAREYLNAKMWAFITFMLAVSSLTVLSVSMG